MILLLCCVRHTCIVQILLIIYFVKIFIKLIFRLNQTPSADSKFGAIKMDGEKVIKALQSILLSCKSGMVIHDLVKEFREMEGTNIPFKKLGYDTFSDFLRTSGFFVVKSTDDGLMVLAKQTANSKHVNDLVKRQNHSKKTRRSSRRKRSKLQNPRAMITEPADLMPLQQQPKREPEPDPQISLFDLAQLDACDTAVGAISFYCWKKKLSAPSYKFVQMKTKKFICSVEVNEVRYGCYPKEYSTRDEAQVATAEVALQEIKKLVECKKYPVCKDSPHDMAQQIYACIASKENGVFLDKIPSFFEWVETYLILLKTIDEQCINSTAGDK